MVPPLRAIFFDIDDTLYSTTEFATLARRNAIQAMVNVGLNIPIEEGLRELSEVIHEFSSNYQHHFDKLLLRLPEAATRGLNRTILVAAGVVAYHDAKFTRLKPFPDVLPALKRLARTSLIRGIITDGVDIKQAEKLLRLGVHSYLTPGAVVISDQIGISKPNPKIFERACSEMRVAPREAMYVGDHPVKDIDPANRIGMVTVLADRGGRHSDEIGRTRAHFHVRNFDQLLNLLRKRFKVSIPA
ncbi:MAG: TIGR02253 family HAD-type hydrolase [Planctomycetes bacterium]|nr:TIGR02253 family HAD-type hydrolase [Planctomycetota bacterium]